MVRLEYTGPSLTRAFNVLHYQLTFVAVPGGTLFPGEAASVVIPALLETIQTGPAAAWPATASDQVRITGTSGQSVHPAPRSRLFTDVYPNDGLPGVVAGDPMPLQDSVTIIKRTAVGARWGLGRLFHAGLSEEQQDGGLLNVAELANMSFFADALSANRVYTVAGNTYTWAPCLYAPATPTTPVRITRITDVGLSDRIIKTQRRRRPGKGI